MQSNETNKCICINMKLGKHFRKTEIYTVILFMLVSDLSVMCNCTQYSTHTIQCSAILHNVFHFLLCYEIIHVALFSLSIAIPKTKHLNDCSVNLASYIFLTKFQYKCWELCESVYNLKALTNISVKRNTTLLIWMTAVIRFVYNIKEGVVFSHIYHLNAVLWSVQCTYDVPYR